MARIARGVITLTDIKDGDQGIAGARNAVRYLYKETTTDTAPDAPQATITWSTGSLSSITTGWSEEPPVVDATGTGRPWVSTLTFHQASSSSQTATTAATGSTPKKGFTFDGVVTFSNNNLTDGSSTYDPATVVNSGTTTIDGGKITANSITSLGAVTAGTFSLGSGAFSVNALGHLVATDADISGNITASTLNVDGATISGELIADSLGLQPIVDSVNLSQNSRNYIESLIISKLGASEDLQGDFKSDNTTFDSDDASSEIAKVIGFGHGSKDVTINFSFNKSWVATGNVGQPSVNLQFERAPTGTTSWTVIQAYQTYTGAAYYESETGETFLDISQNITVVDAATGLTDDAVYDYRVVAGSVFNIASGINVPGRLEANEEGGSITTIGGLEAYTKNADNETITGNWTFSGTTSGISYNDLSNKPTLITQTDIDNSITALVGSAPTTLDTLNELAAALGDDDNFSTTMTTALGTKWTQDNTKISNWDDAYGWGNHSGLYISKTRRTNCSNAGEGWYRIARSDASSGRGSFQISFFGYGGSNTPQETIIRGTMGYGTTHPRFISIENANNSRATKVRGVQDGGKSFIEVYLPSAFTTLGVECSNFGIGNFRVTDTAALDIATGTESSISPEYDIIYNGKVLIGDAEVDGDVNFTGTITASGYNKSDWDAAYGWGDHSTQGYLTSISTPREITYGNGTISGSNTFRLAGTGIQTRFSLVGYNEQDTEWEWRFTQADDATPVPVNVMTLTPTSSTSANLSVTGTLSASGYNSTNWDTAYGWGNHASAGYLTSFDITTQTDSKYLRSNANDSYSGNITATADDWYLWSLGARGASGGEYGIGNRNDNSFRQLTFHVPNRAAYANSGVIPSFGWYSNGAVELMKLTSDDGDLSVKGGYQVNGTTVVDSSRNLTNINTITASGLIKGNQLASNYWVTKQLSGTQMGNSYNERVILICPKVETNTVHNNIVDGKITMLKSGGNVCDSFEVFCHSVYNDTRATFTSRGQRTAHKFVTCTYGGIKWVAIKFEFTANPYNYALFQGQAYTNVTGHADNQLKIVSYYDTLNGGTILDSEIYNSIADYNPDNTYTVFENGSTTFNSPVYGKSDIRSFYSGTNYAQLESNISGGVLKLEGGGSTLLRSYGVSEFPNGLAIGTTTVIDSSRNLTNIGTISASGGISVTGYNTISSYAGSFSFITGSLTGNVTGTLTGNASSASKWTTARTLSLTGDVTGSVSIDGSANASITTVVANDSHTHDGRYYTETESDARFVNVTGDTMTGNLNFTADNVGIAYTGHSGIYMEGKKSLWSHNNGHVTLSAAGGDLYLGYNSGTDYVTGLITLHADTYNSTKATKIIDHDTGRVWSEGSRVFADNYHPNADKWTTARSHTVTLTGDVTGTATQSVDGTGNKTWSISTVVGNDSHNHNHSDGSFTVNGTLFVNPNTTSSYIRMGDTDHGSRDIHCNSNRIGFLNSSGNWGSWSNDDGSWQTAVGFGINNTTVIDSSRNGYLKSLRLDSGNNIEWGGAYASGYPTIAASGSSASGFLAFYPTGSTNGETVRFNSAGINAKVGGYQINGTTVIDSSRNGLFNTVSTSGKAYIGTDNDFIRVGGLGGGKSGVFGNRMNNDSTLSYSSYLAYDAFWNGSAWQANRTTISRKWMTQIGGYHDDSFHINRYGGSAAGTWADSDWTRLLTLSSTGVLNIAGACQLNGATLVNSDRGNLYLNSSNVGDGNGIFFRDGFGVGNYNCSITAADHSGSFADGLHISGYDGVTIGTGSNAKVTKLRIDQAGDTTVYGNFKVNNTTVIDSGRNINCNSIDNHGQQFWRSPSDAYQRVDSRDESTLARAHWYGVSTTGGTSNFRHAWYDGNSYVNVTAESDGVTFGGALNPTSYKVSGMTVIDSSRNLTNIGTINKTLITASEGREIESYMPASYTTSNIVSGHRYGWYNDNWYIGMCRSGNTAGEDFGFDYNGSRKFGITNTGQVEVNGVAVIDSSRNAIGFVDIKGSGSYHEFGNAIGSVSNDGSWNARLNVAGTQHARLDVKSVSDGIITSVYSHTGQDRGFVGTSSAHKLGLASNGTVRWYIETDGKLRHNDVSTLGMGDGGIRSKGAIDSGDVSTGAFRVYNGSTFRGGFGTSLWGFGSGYASDDMCVYSVGDQINLATNGSIRTRITSSGVNVLTGGYLINDTTVIDSSRNLTNIGTVNCGEIVANRVECGYDHNVANSIGCSAWFRSTGQTGWYNASYTGGIYMTDSTWVRTYNNKSFYVGGGSIATTGNVSAYYSDMRLKTKVADIINPLDMVSKLSGFYYTENETAKSLGYKSDKQQVALSAQDVQSVLPEAVSLAPFDMETDDATGEIKSKSGENYLTVDYAKLVPLLVEAIKELKTEIEVLKNGTNSN